MNHIQCFSIIGQDLIKILCFDYNIYIVYLVSTAVFFVITRVYSFFCLFSIFKRFHIVEGQYILALYHSTTLRPYLKSCSELAYLLRPRTTKITSILTA